MDGEQNALAQLTGGNTVGRQRVVDMAAEAFARRGYHGVSTRQLADMLGIKVASIYFHIRSKEELLEQVCAVGIARSFISLEDVLDQASDMSARIRLLFERTGEDLDAYADYMHVCVTEVRHLPEEARGRVGDITARYYRGIRRLFAEASENGELRSDISVSCATLLTVGAIRSAVDLLLDRPTAESIPHLKSSGEVLVRGLAPPCH